MPVARAVPPTSVELIYRMMMRKKTPFVAGTGGTILRRDEVWPHPSQTTTTMCSALPTAAARSGPAQSREARMKELVTNRKDRFATHNFSGESGRPLPKRSKHESGLLNR
jgi:hypothetical protein